MKNAHPRSLMLLAQYAAERIDQFLSHETPPRDLGDMTTWRLDRPEYLLEVVDGVLNDPGFNKHRVQWLDFKRQLDTVAQPAWQRGFDTCHREGIENADDPALLGETAALSAEKNTDCQMWFYEGWLAGLEDLEIEF